MPIAVSKVVSEKLTVINYKEAHRTFKIALCLIGSIGVFTSIFLFLSSIYLINNIWPPDTYYPLIGLILAPSFVSVMAVFRGYFQGMQNMLPTAISQLFEALGRLFIGLGLAYLFSSKGISYAAGGAIL